MADLSLTAASVLAGTDATTEQGIAGATIVAGQVCALDSATNKYILADSNSATAGVRSPRGIALNGAANGQPLVILRAGPITIGGTLVAGTVYALSETPGGIQPVADLGSGEYPAVLGVATSTSVLNVKIQEAGVAI